MKMQKKIKSGSALFYCLPLILALFVICVSLFTTSTSSSKISKIGWDKTQADALAETGISALYSQMTNVPANSSTINASPIATTTLSGTLGTEPAEADGTYSSRVLSSSSANVGGQLTYTYVIEGTGTSRGGSPTSKCRTTFTMTANGMSGYTLGDQAIKTAGNVTLSGGSFTQDNSGNHAASISANGYIADSSSGLTIDGTASYYSSSSLSGKAYAIDPLTSPMSFPDSTTTSSWRTTWINQSEESTPSHPGGNIVSGSLSYGVNGTLTGPIYISGNLTVSGGHTLTINPDPAATPPCVVFVHGSVTVSGGSSLVNNGVLIVSDGTQTYSGGAGVYSVKDMVNCGLISFSTSSNNAVSITGGSGVANVGVIYAINGGATLSGGSVFQGSLTAGGVGSTVTLSGGSSVRYQGGWNNGFGPFAPGYTASGLTHWVRTL